jgi:hypothetical protein
MKQISTIFFRSLPNDEHLQFQTDVKALIDANKPSALRITNLYVVYDQAYTTEKVTIETVLANPLTKVIKEADTFRDMLEHGFYLFVESETMHFNPSHREAAGKIIHLLDQYGDLRDLNYSKKSSNILTRNDELRNTCMGDIETIGGTEWLNAIEAAAIDFNTKYNTRSMHEAGKSNHNVGAARIQIDSALDAIVKQINAVNWVNGVGEYDEFIDQMNHIIKHYKGLIVARKGRKKAEDTPTTPEK